MQPELDGLFWKDRSIRCGGADAEQTLRAVVQWWRDRAELPVPWKYSRALQVSAHAVAVLERATRKGPGNYALTSSKTASEFVGTELR